LDLAAGDCRLRCSIAAVMEEQCLCGNCDM
jgi:hypothetical protein